MNGITPPMNCGHRVEPGTLPVAKDFNADPFLESDIDFLSRGIPLSSTPHYQEASIDRLPLEILAAIFTLTRTNRTSWTEASRKWIHCTQVSRRWRWVALFFPNLWTCIDTEWRIAETFLRRSGNTLLVLRMHMKTCVSVLECQATSSAFKHMHRTRELYLRVDGTKELSNIAFPLRQSGLSTVLETLEVYGAYGPFTLPHDIFSETYVKLRSLNLINAFPPYPPGLLRNTRHLTILWSERRDSATVIPLLRMLESCISIEEFDFCDRSEHNTDIVTSSITVPLPRLRRLSLVNSLSSTGIQLLNHLSLPVLVSSYITGTSEPALNMPSAFMSVYDSCRVDMYDEGFHAGFTCKTNLTFCMDVHLAASMRSNGLETFSSVFQAAFPFLSSLNLGFTSSMSSSGPHPYPTTIWKESLENLPNLQELTFRNIYGYGACTQSAINLLLSLSSGPTPTGCYCPQLRNLAFVNVSVKHPAEQIVYALTEDVTVVLSPSRAEEPTIRNSLLAYVIGRSRDHARLAKLDISECRDIDEPLLESLEPFVDEILPKGLFFRDYVVFGDFN
ncbi:hypothetical protein BD410DRAFT_900938 [Rickenella mellea]|uniref:Uncharacterized protein n=1 Tax=Rickenella mellea TaxID=50990 RepID=A0A4Y7PS67_9AGAM|nr:hypothetical protein BD410DRAFT_900938 [Rickenella mellea]